jgi:hypothetical protein
MTPDSDQDSFSKLVGKVLSITALMTAVFALLRIFIPDKYTPPIGALLIGLILTAILIWQNREIWVTTVVTWLVVGIGLIIVYLLVSRPVTIVGSMIDGDGKPVVGLSLVFTDSGGVPHKAITDGQGVFEVKNVPRGGFEASVNDNLLLKGTVPSNLKPNFTIGDLVHEPYLVTATLVVTATCPPLPLTSTPSPTLMPTATPTPTNTPTPTATPAPGAIVIASINLRNGPGTDYGILGTLSPGQVLTVTGRITDSTWFRVHVDQSQEGWVAGEGYVTIVSLPVNRPSIEQIPIITPTPPTRTSTPSSVTTTRAATAFQDFEPGNGTPGDYFWNAWFMICSFSAETVHRGGQAVCCQAVAAPPDTGGTVGIKPASSQPIDLSVAETFYVWVYDQQGSNTVELKLCDNIGCSHNVWSEMESSQGGWTQITWPLSKFSGVDTTDVRSIEIYEWNNGTYCFDTIGWNTGSE